MKNLIRLAYVFLFAALLTSIIYPQTKDRKDIPEKYTWNLADVYPDVAAWHKSADKIKGMISKLEGYKGKLGESASVFKEAVTQYFEMRKEFYKLFGYASKKSDVDVSITENQELQQLAYNLGTELSEKTAYMRPEILNIEPEKIASFFKSEPSLAEYKMYVDDIQRTREHTLPADQEQILASFGLISGTPADVYNVFCNAEMPNPNVTLSSGETVELSAPAFTKYRTVPERVDREKVFNTFFSNYKKYQNTLGANFAGKIKTDFLYAKLRKYPTAMAASVDGYNIPVSVYENLVKQINNNLPTLHRFLDLKKRMLGVDTLHYYDLYTPIVKKADMHFTIEEGQKVILDALKPLGNEYTTTLGTAFNNRWIDYLPNTGKKSGAYSSGEAYDVHPYILMNWNDDYESVSTLAHEVGHTMHSYFSNKNQPFVTSDYATFVAEIASTINENLMNNYMVKNAKSDEEKLSLLGSYLELLRTTIFRQTLFAEFEWEVHKLAENNQPITGEGLSEIYLAITKKYYGDDKGACKVDPYIAYEWAYIPHFLNYTYYVYQYATSLIYATALAEKIVTEGQPAIDRYYTIIKGGSSEYPVDLVKKAGVDPLSSEAFELTMKKMNSIMDQIEEIINKK